MPSGVLLFLTALPMAAVWTVGCADRVSVSEASEPDADPAATTWTVASEPVLSIGVLSGEEPYQLHQVKSAARLPGGGVVVANGGSGELRFFGEDGHYLKSQGRRGDGPGEWQGPDRVRRLEGGSLLVLDTRLGRRGIVSAEGEFEGSTATDRALLLPWDHWFYGGFLVDSPLEYDERSALVAALDRIGSSSPSESLSLARVTPAGHIWVSPWVTTDEAVRWAVYDLRGRSLATVVTPARFELHDQGEDWILGVQRDSLDVEHVVLYGLDRADSPYDAGALGRAAREVENPMPEQALVAASTYPDLSAAVKQLAMLQEMHWAERYTYSAHLDSLQSVSRPRFELPEGVVFQPLRAGSDGWAGRVYREGGREGCMITYGRFALLGTRSGSVTCWGTAQGEPASTP